MGAFTSEAVRKHSPAFWMPLAHAAAVRSHPNLRLVALCDPDPEGLSRAAAEYDVAQTFADHRDMLAAIAPSLVTIATRTIGRAGMIADCLAAGIRALHVEKPLCSSVQELEMLEGLLAEDSRYLTLGAVRRFLPPYREAVRLATAPEAGNVLEARISVGSGALYWAHPHSVDLLLFAAAGRKVQAVSARMAGLSARGAVVSNDPVIASATIWFEGGFVGHVGRALGSDFQIVSERAQYTVVNDGVALTGARYEDGESYPAHHELPIPANDGPGGSAAPIHQLVASLREDPDAISANLALRRDILLGQRILFAMVQSHLDGGRPVTPEAIDPDLFIEARTGGRYA